MSLRDDWIRVASLAKGTALIDDAVRYNPIARARVMRAIADFSKADLASRRRLANAMSSQIIRHAGKTKYGKQYPNNIAQFPVLHKHALRLDQTLFMKSSLISIPASTSGTTGSPLQLIRSATSVAAEQAFLDNMLTPYNLIMKTARLAVLRGEVIKPVNDNSPPFGAERFHKRRLFLSSYHLSPETIDWYAEALHKFKPDVLWVYPSSICTFVRLLRDKQVKIPIILSSSEMMSASLRAALEDTFSAEVIDYYGQAERMVLAVSTSPQEYWFNPAYGRVELIEVECEEFASDVRRMRIIATGYWNKAMPIIRYDTGDFAFVPRDASEEELEKIELGLLPFKGISGRQEEFILRPDGRKIIGLDHIPREVENILQVQFVQQELSSIQIRVLATPAFSRPDIQRLLENARTKIPDTMEIAVRIVDFLEQLESGKTPFVIRSATLPVEAAALEPAPPRTRGGAAARTGSGYQRTA